MRLLLVDGCRREDGPGREAEAQLRALGAETERFRPLYTEDLPCAGCGACHGSGLCVADPRAGDFLRAAAGCDGLLLVCPAGLLGIDVHAKNLLERAALLAARREKSPFAGKPAAALLAGKRTGARASAQAEGLLRALGLAVRDVESLRNEIKEEAT